MAESDKTEKLFFDAPTKGLILLAGGFAVLVVGLSVRAWLSLPKSPRRVAVTTRPRPTPTPIPEDALLLFEDRDLRRVSWQLSHASPDSTELLAPSGAIFEQKLLNLSEGLSPRTILERLDERLSGWGQEYQRVRLESVERGGLKMTRLEYALNLPGKPTQRTVVVAGRVRLNGEKRVVSWTLAAPELTFERDRDVLDRAGIKL
ncbi:hypothetical protein [Armatimonas rosea]|uniref:Uncharacterized protein n=1 Tax=Armatimonas rosea TaxID=685828 RepID=A0A7W9W8Q6_ARMRO|nr:hypothetical protein [Armatimonas rosea]MBB6052410.1 hypothetical protein [Armatimonas rosea]